MTAFWLWFIPSFAFLCVLLVILFSIWWCNVLAIRQELYFQRQCHPYVNVHNQVILTPNDLYCGCGKNSNSCGKCKKTGGGYGNGGGCGSGGGCNSGGCNSCGSHPKDKKNDHSDCGGTCGTRECETIYGRWSTSRTFREGTATAANFNGYVQPYNAY